MEMEDLLQSIIHYPFDFTLHMFIQISIDTTLALTLMHPFCLMGTFRVVRHVMTVTTHFYSGTGSFINPYIMDPTNPAIIYTCNDIVWKTSNARAASVTWTSLGNLKPTGSGTEPTAMAITSNSATIFVGDSDGKSRQS